MAAPPIVTVSAMVALRDEPQIELVLPGPSVQVHLLESAFKTVGQSGAAVKVGSVLELVGMAKAAATVTAWSCKAKLLPFESRWVTRN